MFATSISRGRFLRGDFGGRRRPIRPPWALAEDEFIERCTRCADCIGACPTRIVAKGPGGFPHIDFSRGECTFCGRCASACRAGALRIGAEGAPWRLAATIADRCLALNAIRFGARAGGVAVPELAPDRCSGCGACFGICPVNAIEISEPTQSMPT
ncbi:MAG: napF [Proteobacteria bacterium]|nr:napF [Pseudomonadota bacterium]